MFFEHIFLPPTFLTVFALFYGFFSLPHFCDSLRFFEHISSYFEYYEEVFKSNYAFLMLPTYFFTQPKLSFIDTIYIIDNINRSMIDGIETTDDSNYSDDINEWELSFQKDKRRNVTIVRVRRFYACLLILLEGYY